MKKITTYKNDQFFLANKSKIKFRTACVLKAKIRGKMLAETEMCLGSAWFQ